MEARYAIPNRDGSLATEKIMEIFVMFFPSAIAGKNSPIIVSILVRLLCGNYMSPEK